LQIDPDWSSGGPDPSPGFFQRSEGAPSATLLAIGLPFSFAEFDKLLRLAVERITNSSLTDTQWLQASLPIRNGGFGVRRVSSLALPAFLASAAGTALLQAEILADCNVPEDPYWKDYLQLWLASGNETPDPYL